MRSSHDGYRNCKCSFLLFKNNRILPLRILTTFLFDELEIRKNEMYKLEKAIKELHSLFVEMANLVDEQGEMVNRILDNVTNTEAYVEKAVEDVHQAARYQSSARRKKIWLFIFCLIGLAVIALIIYLSIPKSG